MAKKLSLLKLSQKDLSEVKAGLVAGCMVAVSAEAVAGACLCSQCSSCPRLQGPCCIIYNPIEQEQ